MKTDSALVPISMRPHPLEGGRVTRFIETTTIAAMIRSCLIQLGRVRNIWRCVAE
jgi:hypothetical protein